MFTPSNILSLLRLPLAFVFLSHSPLLRTLATLSAMLSDGLDGYIARRYNQTTRLGAILDPLTDKFFVFFVLSLFLFEGKLLPWQALLIISRDFVIFFLGLYLFFSKQLKSYEIKAMRSGKVATALQFVTLILLSLSLTPPFWIYPVFFILSLSFLIEGFLSIRYFLENK